MSAQTPGGIVLAAGKGTRMVSDLPKVLHEVCGVPMVELVVDALRAAGVARPVVVVGHGAEFVQARLGNRVDYALQAVQRGTGHAALMAADALAGFEGPVLIVPGDTPLLDSATLERLLGHHQSTRAALTLATTQVEDPTGYGRIVRDEAGRVAAIVEHRDATPEQRAIREINPSLYCVQAGLLFEILPTLGSDNAQGEIYLTDLVGAIHARLGQIEAVSFDDPALFMGVNDRWQLSEANQALRMRILRRHALAGVSIVDPATTTIGPRVRLEPDVTVEAMTQVLGETEVASKSILGPFSRVLDSKIGMGCKVLMSLVNGAVMEDGSRCGPYAHLRPGTRLGVGVKIGNFVETKKAELDEGVSVSHLTYLGDCAIGARTNIGAGTITCNYDGVNKHRTTIGADAFIGSNSTLVAPVAIGEGAIVGAGSTITEDVPAEALALGRERQINKEAWALKWKRPKKDSAV